MPCSMHLQQKFQPDRDQQQTVQGPCHRRDGHCLLGLYNSVPQTIDKIKRDLLYLFIKHDEVHVELLLPEIEILKRTKN